LGQQSSQKTDVQHKKGDKKGERNKDVLSRKVRGVDPKRKLSGHEQSELKRGPGRRKISTKSGRVEVCSGKEKGVGRGSGRKPDLGQLISKRRGLK